MGKFYKVIISVFIFISFLYPLTEFNPADFRINFNLESEYENLIENTAKAEIENLVKDVLIKNEIYNSSVSAQVQQSGDEMIINRLLVSVTDDYSVEEVKDLIFKNLGMVADVKRIGE